MSKRNILYRVFVYNNESFAECVFESSQEKKAEDYVHQNLMKQDKILKFYIDKCEKSLSHRDRFIDEDD